MSSFGFGLPPGDYHEGYRVRWGGHATHSMVLSGSFMVLVSATVSMLTYSHYHQCHAPGPFSQKYNAGWWPGGGSTSPCLKPCKVVVVLGGLLLLAVGDELQKR